MVVLRDTPHEQDNLLAAASYCQVCHVLLPFFFSTHFLFADGTACKIQVSAFDLGTPHFVGLKIQGTYKAAFSKKPVICVDE